MMRHLCRHRFAFVLTFLCANHCRLKKNVVVLSSIITLAEAHSFPREIPSKPFGLSILEQEQGNRPGQWNESSSSPLSDILLTAEKDLDSLTNDMFSSLSLPLTYTILKGRSALRDLPPECTKLLRPESLGLTVAKNDDSATSANDATRLFIATLLLLKRQIDASHDTILGVTIDNISEGEYAATHRGQTDWYERHPLTDSADLLHALVHRLEGSHVGEGGHTGYNNAKYWLAGGPKMLDAPAGHYVRMELTKRAWTVAPRCVSSLGLIASSSSTSSSHENGNNRGGVKHTIIAGGGKNRTVGVYDGEWDAFAFVDACQKAESGKLSQEECHELRELQRLEIRLFLRGELMKVLGDDGGECDDERGMIRTSDYNDGGNVNGGNGGDAEGKEEL